MHFYDNAVISGTGDSGGMLLACGFATLLPTLWRSRRGQGWLWCALMVAVNIALARIMVHWTMGYESLKHMLPAYGGLTLLWAGGVASYSFQVSLDSKLEPEWHKRIANVLRSNRSRDRR